MGAGPGPNFQSVLLQPKKGKEEHLHKALCALYGGGSAINIEVRTPSAAHRAALRAALRAAHRTSPTAPPPPRRPPHLCAAGGRDARARRDGRVLPVRLRADGHGGAGRVASRGAARGAEDDDQSRGRACGVLRGSSGRAGRRAGSGGGCAVVVPPTCCVSCGRLREAGVSPGARAR